MPSFSASIAILSPDGQRTIGLGIGHRAGFRGAYLLDATISINNRDRLGCHEDSSHTSGYQRK